MATSRRYLDAENVEREVNGLATKQTSFSAKGSPHNTVNSILILECKKNEANHWVFFDEGLPFPVLNVISTLSSKQNDQLASTLGTEPQSPRHHHYFRVRATRSYCMAFKSAKEQIFEGLQELFNAYKHQREATEKYMSEREPGRGIWVNVYYPVLVFDGKLFIAKTKDEDLEVEEAEQTLYVERHPSYLRTWITIDVVRADLFPKYLESLEQDHEIIVSYIQSKFVPKESSSPEVL